MKITVDLELDDVLSDMFYDESTDLVSELKSHITQNTIKQLLPKIQERIDLLIGEKIKPVIDSRVDQKISKALDDVINGGKIKVGREEPRTIEEIVEKQFKESRQWGGPIKQIDIVSEKFAAEMKKQYDVIFATKIVQGLQKQGLLNEDVAKILLGN